MKAITLCFFATLVATPAAAERVVLTADQVQAILAQPAPGAPAIKIANPAHLDLRDPNVRRDVATRLLGHGFDVWTQLPTQNRCVSFPSSFIQYVPGTPGIWNNKNWSNIVQVTNLSEHSSNQSSGGSVSLTYKAFSLGASHSAASSNTFSSYSSYISVDKGLIGDVAGLVTPVGSTAQILPAQVASDAIKRDAGEFSRLCGQAYVARVMLGEQITGSLDYTTVMNGSSSANSTAVSAGVAGIVTGSFSSAAQYADLATKATLNYRVRGGPAQDQDPSKWLETIRAYGTDGNFNQAAMVIMIDTNPYGGIPSRLFADFVDADELGRGTVAGLRDEFMSGTQLLSDLLFARSHPAQFTKLAPAELTAQIKIMEDYLDAVGDVYQVCRKAVSRTTADACRSSARALKRPDFILRPELS